MYKNPETKMVLNILSNIKTIQELSIPVRNETISKKKYVSKTNKIDFIDSSRIDEIRKILSKKYDLSKLIEFCEELNINFNNKCYLAVPMICRALLDHVPPIFNCKNFPEVSNNYLGGTKSFKESMQHLDRSLRNIADAKLHVQIRSSETLPNKTQVNFSNDLDVLLEEIVRVLKSEK